MGVYSPSPGTIYPRLARLEEEGLVTHDEVDGRKVYRITDAGREELRSRSDELDELEEELSASVSDIVREVREDVRQTVRSLREELTFAARESRRVSKDATADVREQARQARDQAGQAGEDAREQARQAKEDAREAARRIRDEVREQVRQARDAAREQSREAREDAGEPGPPPGGCTCRRGGCARRPRARDFRPARRIRTCPRAARPGRRGRTGLVAAAGTTGRGCGAGPAGANRSTSGRSVTWSGWPSSSPPT